MGVFGLHETVVSALPSLFSLALHTVAATVDVEHAPRGAGVSTPPAVCPSTHQALWIDPMYLLEFASSSCSALTVEVRSPTKALESVFGR